MMCPTVRVFAKAAERLRCGQDGKTGFLRGCAATTVRRTHARSAVGLPEAGKCGCSSGSGTKFGKVVDFQVWIKLAVTVPQSHVSDEMNTVL